MPGELPPDPFTKLAEGMAQMHEMVLEAMKAGFTREEAFRILLIAIEKTE
jgi:hypothetical protein